jgi:large subunit ribosomal protein L4
MIEAPHFSSSGARKSADLALPSAVFDGRVHGPVMHEAVKVHRANQRQGTHATKTRGMVSGGNRKPWRQKGTGRARQGSTRSPLWPGGGKVFGPQPRDYSLTLPRKVRHLARHSALNARAAEGNLYVIERFEQQNPRTRELEALLATIGLAERKVLILTHGLSEAVYYSGRNLPQVEVRPYSDASAYDILWSEVVLVEEPALSGEMPVPFRRPMVPLPKPEPGATPRPARPKPAPGEAGKAAKKAAARPGAKAKAAAPKAKAKGPAKKAAAKKPSAKPKKKGGK